ncbi:MAG: hypothetical protein A2X36_16670 [Elusimicrobia bacterium GWA2_69_24]|nr:MAG: hypothetical protein A2X36_16670 [Elusimicrobia bacterium GWA2_69_24]HBL16650.1 hypothetical protein [Elusimicrobiota bacterium]
MKEYARFVDLFFDHNLSGFFGLRDETAEPLSARAVRNEWSALVRELRREGRAELFDLYVGVPFCGRLCRFCNLSPERLGARSRVEEYLCWLDEAIGFFRPAFAKVRFGNLLLGGGTPSVLSAAQLDRLFRGLFGAFRFDPAGEKSFEFHPSSFSERKLEVLREHGFNRVILGVQSLTPGVLRRAGRTDQTAGQVERAVRAVARAGFPRGQNVDLILGLEGETPASFLRSFERAADLGPEEISVYLLKPFGPHMARYGRSVGLFYEQADLRRSFAAVPERMIRAAERRGYRVNESPLLDLRYAFMKRSLPVEKRYYSDTPLGGSSLFALGSMARSHVCGRMSYACGPVRGAFDPEARIYDARKVDLDNEMFRWLSHHLLSEWGLSLARFREVFGRSFESRFAAPLRRLRRDGLLRRAQGRLLCAKDSLKDRLATRLCFVGLPALRAMLDAHNSPENQVRLVAGAAEYGVWVERSRPEQRYVSSAGSYGLQVARLRPGPFSPWEMKLVRWLGDLFQSLQAGAGEACGAERTYALHEAVARHLSGAAPGRLTLKPWIRVSDRSGLGYSRAGVQDGGMRL